MQSETGPLPRSSIAMRDIAVFCMMPAVNLTAFRVQSSVVHRAAGSADSDVQAVTMSAGASNSISVSVCVVGVIPLGTMLRPHNALMIADFP